MPMALVIQSSEPTQGPKMPQGLVISGLRNPEQADNTASKTQVLSLSTDFSVLCFLQGFGLRAWGWGKPCFRAYVLSHWTRGDGKKVSVW